MSLIGFYSMVAFPHILCVFHFTHTNSQRIVKLSCKLQRDEYTLLQARSECSTVRNSISRTLDFISARRGFECIPYPEQMKWTSLNKCSLCLVVGVAIVPSKATKYSDVFGQASHLQNCIHVEPTSRHSARLHSRIFNTI